MVPHDSLDENGDPLLSSNPANCVIDSTLFDTSNLDIDYCMSDQVDIDYSTARGIINTRFKRADNDGLLGIGAQSNCSPPDLDGTATSTLTNPFTMQIRL